MPKPYFIILSVVAYSEFAAIFKLLGFGSKMRFLLSVVYVLLTGTIFRAMP